MIKIAITGAGGRMGRRLAALAIESEKFDIVAAMEAAGHEAVGKDIGELAGVEGLSPHDCRHAWATRNAKHGLEWLQQAGGWSSLAMPERYVEAAKIANEGAEVD